MADAGRGSGLARNKSVNAGMVFASAHRRMPSDPYQVLFASRSVDSIGNVLKRHWAYNLAPIPVIPLNVSWSRASS